MLRVAEHNSHAGTCCLGTSVFARCSEGVGKAIKTDLEEPQRRFDLDLTGLVDYLATGFELKMCRPQVGVIIVSVPAQTHDIIGPLDTLDVSPFTRPPQHLQCRRLSWKRIAKVHLDVDVCNDGPWPNPRGLVSNVGSTGDVLHSFFEPPKSFAPGESSATRQQ
jgi:hypothetical protein